MACKRLTEQEYQDFIQRNPQAVGYDAEGQCGCSVYVCAIREDSCAQYPLNYGRWFWLADGRWTVGDNGCARTPPFGTCTIADRPNRRGAFEGEIVNVGCESVEPNTKLCITEEEFGRGGWVKVSGPYDTAQECDSACNPP